MNSGNYFRVFLQPLAVTRAGDTPLTHRRWSWLAWWDWSWPSASVEYHKCPHHPSAWPGPLGRILRSQRCPGKVILWKMLQCSFFSEKLSVKKEQIKNANIIFLLYCSEFSTRYLNRLQPTLHSWKIFAWIIF